MTVAVTQEAPDHPDVAPLLAASDAVSAALYPPASNHVVGLDILLDPAVIFLVARLSGRAAGCGALLASRNVSAELKRMFVADAARGRGIGRAILQALEDRARASGIGLIQLETGIHSHAALHLYRTAGYREREPFGSYRPDPLSVFMEKHLLTGRDRSATSFGCP